jgi:hypothetical protein
MSSEGTVTSIKEFGALKRNSSDHIRGVESNSSDMIRGVVSRGSEICGGNNFNFFECIREVSNNFSDVLERVTLKVFGLELGIFFVKMESDPGKNHD